jgi:hypothetical protein
MTYVREEDNGALPEGDARTEQHLGLTLGEYDLSRFRSRLAFWRRDLFFVNSRWPRANLKIEDFGAFCLQFEGQNATLTALGSTIEVCRREGSLYKRNKVVPLHEFRQHERRRAKAQHGQNESATSPNVRLGGLNADAPAGQDELGAPGADTTTMAMERRFDSFTLCGGDAIIGERTALRFCPQDPITITFDVNNQGET